jgi:intracellular multiplication protein IcmW
MPDLSSESVHAFWHEYDSRILYRIVCSLEATESWVPEHPKIEELIRDLGDVLDSSTSINQLSQETIIQLLTSIKFTQALRLMHAIETKSPGFVSGLLVWSEEQKGSKEQAAPSNVFLKRNMVFERLQLLSRIFSQERINLLNRAQEYGNAS